MAVRVQGGQKLAAFFRTARNAQRFAIKGIEVGFLSSAKYEDGTPVASVAAWNEFGTQRANGSTHIPERPFFRTSNKTMRRQVLAVLKGRVDPRTMAVDARTAGLVGQTAKREIQRNIRDGIWEPNAPSTIARKRSDTPLIDTGHMRRSVDYKPIG